LKAAISQRLTAAVSMENTGEKCAKSQPDIPSTGLTQGRLSEKNADSERLTANAIF